MVPPTPARPSPRMVSSLVKLGGRLQLPHPPPRARTKGTRLKREARRDALPFDLQPQSSHSGCGSPGPSEIPKVHLPSRAKSRVSPAPFQISEWQGGLVRGATVTWRPLWPGCKRFLLTAVTPAFWFSPKHRGIWKRGCETGIRGSGPPPGFLWVTFKEKQTSHGLIRGLPQDAQPQLFPGKANVKRRLWRRRPLIPAL